MNKVKKAYEKINLTDEEKRRLYYKIKAEVNEEKKSKISIWNYKKLVSFAAVAICAIVICTNSTVQVKAGEYIKNIAKWITGNTTNDYIEEINETKENNNIKFTIESIQRVGYEVKVEYELIFPFNIEDKIKLKDNGLFESEVFDDCKIYANDECITNKEDINYWYYKVKDTEIKDNKLKQELILNINETDKDLEIKFDYKKFKIDGKEINAELYNSCTLPSNKYEGDIEIIYIPEHKAKINNDDYTFYGYSYTKTGIRIYGKENRNNVVYNGEDRVYLIITDNYGRKYLFEPTTNYYSNHLKYTISEGMKKDIQYSNVLNENIENIKVEIMHEYTEEKTNEYKNEKIMEFEINFEK